MKWPNVILASKWPQRDVRKRDCENINSVWLRRNTGAGKHGTCFDLSLLFMGNSLELTATKSPVSCTGIDISPVNAIYTGILMNIVHTGLCWTGTRRFCFYCVLGFVAGTFVENIYFIWAFTSNCKTHALDAIWQIHYNTSVLDCFRVFCFKFWL